MYTSMILPDCAVASILLLFADDTKCFKPVGNLFDSHQLQFAKLSMQMEFRLESFFQLIKVCTHELQA